MIKVMVYEHEFKGSNMDESATPIDRDHKMTPTPSGTMSIKDSTWRISSNQLKTVKISSFSNMFFKSFPTDPGSSGTSKQTLMTPTSKTHISTDPS